MTASFDADGDLPSNESLFGFAKVNVLCTVGYQSHCGSAERYRDTTGDVPRVVTRSEYV